MNKGQRVGRLTAIMEVEKKRWLCVCDCGNEKVVRVDHLRSGATSSCGCLRLETMRRRWSEMVKHGDCRRSTGKAKEWIVWQGVVNRCYRPRSSAYFRYGARGVTMCDAWRNSYECFLADMGRMPTPKHTIERINNELGYSPENCRWATRKEQANNRSTNHWLALNGEKKTCSQWSSVVGIPSLTLVARKARGWSDEKTLTTPLTRRAA